MAQLGIPAVSSVGEEKDVGQKVEGAVVDGDGVECFVAICVEGSAAMHHDVSPAYLAVLDSKNDCGYLYACWSGEGTSVGSEGPSVCEYSHSVDSGRLLCDYKLPQATGRSVCRG